MSLKYEKIFILREAGLPCEIIKKIIIIQSIYELIDKKKDCILNIIKGNFKSSLHFIISYLHGQSVSSRSHGYTIFHPMLHHYL